ncbi:MAG: T9SS type A sorting domain-containing protein, partial [Bacteroidota bacterium]
KVYGDDCLLESVGYGADSPPCLCDGVVRLELMRFLCQVYCEDIQLPDCDAAGKSNPKGTVLGNIEQTGSLLCTNDPCGSYSGEDCVSNYTLALSNIIDCFAGGINGTLVDANTGTPAICLDDALVSWIHWIPNPDYPQNSTAKFIPNASGSGSQVSSCLCGGRVVARIKNRCCEIDEFTFNTPPCDDSAGRVGRSFGVLNNKAKAHIFPNPAQQFFTLNIEAKENSNVQVQLFDLAGQLVKSVPSIQTANRSISLLGLAPGVYWVKVSGSVTFTEKLIVQ